MSLEKKKQTTQQIQDEWIERIRYFWLNTFKQKIEVSQIQMLVYGSRKRGVYGFGDFEVLGAWLEQVKAEKIKGSAFAYALSVAKGEDTTHPYRKIAERRQGPQQFGEILEQIRTSQKK